MRTTLTCLLSLALVACGDDTVIDPTSSNNTSTDPGTTADPPSTGPVTTDTPEPITSGDDASESATDTLPGTTTPPTTETPDTSTTSPDETTSTTDAPSDTTSSDDTTTTDDSTTGAPLGCGFVGTELEAFLVHDGKPPPLGCGTFEFVGQNIANDVGPVYKLDGCPCGSDCFAPDPWTFTLSVPNEALPAQMPVCPRIVVERQMSKKGCELIGVTILETANQDFPFPWYVAGSLLGPPEAAAGLTVTTSSVEVCECDGCCSPPERYDLEFGFQGDSLALAEDSHGWFGDPNGTHIDLYNYQSHLSGICDDSPAIDWVFSLQIDE